MDLGPTVSSLRVFIDNSLLPDKDLATDWIRWIPNKVNFFLWQFKRNRLATKDNLEKRGVRMQSKDCQLCYSVEESLDHIMGDCSTAKLVMAFLFRWVHWWPQTETSARNIWTAISDDKGERKGRTKDVKKVIGAVYFWTMWRVRNGKVMVRWQEKSKSSKIFNIWLSSGSEIDPTLGSS